MKLSKKISRSHELNMIVDIFHSYYNEMRECSEKYRHFYSPEEDPLIVIIGKIISAIETLENEVENLEKELQDLKNRVEC